MFKKSLISLAMVFCGAMGAAKASSIDVGTSFANGNRGVIFDLASKNAGETHVTGLDFYVSTSTVVPSWELQIWQTNDGSWRNSGNDPYQSASFDANNWTRIDTIPMTYSGGAALFSFDLANELILEAFSTHGIYITTNNSRATVRYGSSSSSVGSVAAENDDLEVLMGRGMSLNFAPLSITDARTFKATLSYDVIAPLLPPGAPAGGSVGPDSVPEPMSLALFAIGLGAFGMGRRGRPAVG